MEKENVLIHFDWFDYFEESELSEEEEMQVIFAAIKYAKDGVNPTFSDRALKVVWLTIKKRVDYDIAAYEERCKKNQENGKKGGRPKTQKTERLFSVSKKNPKNPSVDNGILITDIDIECECDIESAPPEETHTPSLQQVRDFCASEGLAAIDPERFWNYYESCNWLVDGKPMNWQARAKLWNSQDGEKKRSKAALTEFNNFSQRDNNWAAIEKELLKK